MTRYHATSAGNVAFTSTEETEFDAEEASYAAGADARTAEEVRSKRDQLLAKTDWVVIRAKELGQPVPVDYYEYRGDLRQVPEQAGFPHTIIWPTEIEG